MSNFDKAVEIIGELATEYSQFGSDELFGLDEDAALALKEAGLLMPDLPAYSEADAEGAYWYEGTYAIGVDRTAKEPPVRIMLWDSEPGGVFYTDIDSARDYALKILAACEHAELNLK